MNLTGTLSSNGYRFPPFHFSLLSTVIVNIKENSLLSSSSSLTTVSTLRLVIGHRVVPIGTSHLWLLRVWIHHSSASVFPSFSSCWGAKWDRGGFLPPHHPCARWCNLCSEREPSSWLRFFAGLLQPFVLYQLGLGVVAANINSLAFVRMIHHPEGSVSAFSDASVFRILSLVHGVGKVFQFLALCLGLSTAPQVFTRIMAPVRSFLHSLGFGFGLICMTGSFRRPPESRFSFSEDVPLVVQLSRDSRRLGDVSACGASVVISSSESYWTLFVSGLLRPGNESTSFSQLAPCFYHEWIYPHFLARVDEDAVLSDSAHSGGTAADAVVPVVLHRSWVRLDSEALVRWSSEIRQGLFWWWAHKRFELVCSLGRVSPQLPCGPTLPMSVGLSCQPFSGFRVDPESISVSVASVKVVGVTRPVRNHTFSPLLALFFSFPRSQCS